MCIICDSTCFIISNTEDLFDTNNSKIICYYSYQVFHKDNQQNYKKFLSITKQISTVHLVDIIQ